MKKMGKALASIILVGAMLCSMTTTAFAEETVKIDGYNGSQDLNQFSISNVINEDTKEYVEGVTTYICNSPAEITNTVDLAWFTVSTLIDNNGTWIEGQYLNIDGKFEVYDYDTGENKTLDSSKDTINYDDVMMVFEGSKVTLTEPGVYYVCGRYFCIEGAAEAVIVITDSKTTETPAETPVIEEVTAKYTSSNVLVNNTATDFEAYLINQNNYFKLRDIAKAVSGTDKQFEVTWDNTNKTINLISGKAYTEVGGELIKGDGTDKNGKLSTATIYKDGEAISLTAYTINGNNYFKLRDLCKAFDIGVTWDGTTNTVGIDTSISYITE